MQLCTEVNAAQRPTYLKCVGGGKKVTCLVFRVGVWFCFCPESDTKASDVTFKQKRDLLFPKAASLVSVSALKQTQMFKLRHLEDKSRTVPPDYLSQVTVATQRRG